MARHGCNKAQAPISPARSATGALKYLADQLNGLISEKIMVRHGCNKAKALINPPVLQGF